MLKYTIKCYVEMWNFCMHFPMSRVVVWHNDVTAIFKNPHNNNKFLDQNVSKSIILNFWVGIQYGYLF